MTIRVNGRSSRSMMVESRQRRKQFRTLCKRLQAQGLAPDQAEELAMAEVRGNQISVTESKRRRQ